MVAQPLRLHRSIGQENNHQGPDDDCHKTQSKEHGPPTRQTGIWSHMLKGVRNDAAEDLPQSKTKVPE